MTQSATQKIRFETYVVQEKLTRLTEDEALTMLESIAALADSTQRVQLLLQARKRMPSAYSDAVRALLVREAETWPDATLAVAWIEEARASYQDPAQREKLCALWVRRAKEFPNDDPKFRTLAKGALYAGAGTAGEALFLSALQDVFNETENAREKGYYLRLIENECQCAQGLRSSGRRELSDFIAGVYLSSVKSRMSADGKGYSDNITQGVGYVWGHSAHEAAYEDIIRRGLKAIDDPKSRCMLAMWGQVRAAYSPKLGLLFSDVLYQSLAQLKSRQEKIDLLENQSRHIRGNTPAVARNYMTRLALVNESRNPADKERELVNLYARPSSFESPSRGNHFFTEETHQAVRDVNRAITSARLENAGHLPDARDRLRILYKLLQDVQESGPLQDRVLAALEGERALMKDVLSKARVLINAMPWAKQGSPLAERLYKIFQSELAAQPFEAHVELADNMAWTACHKHPALTEDVLAADFKTINTPQMAQHRNDFLRTVFECTHQASQIHQQALVYMGTSYVACPDAARTDRQRAFLKRLKSGSRAVNSRPSTYKRFRFPSCEK